MGSEHASLMMLTSCSLYHHCDNYYYYDKHDNKYKSSNECTKKQLQFQPRCHFLSFFLSNSVPFSEAWLSCQPESTIAALRKRMANTEIVMKRARRAEEFAVGGGGVSRGSGLMPACH